MDDILCWVSFALMCFLSVNTVFLVLFYKKKVNARITWEDNFSYGSSCLMTWGIVLITLIHVGRPSHLWVAQFSGQVIDGKEQREGEHKETSIHSFFL